MPKGRGKGRISNHLVAASCTAVLTVYAAGYWRTRDAARQFETQAKARKSAARAQRTAVSPKRAVIEPSAPPPRPLPEAPATTTASATATVVARSSAVAAPRVRHAPATLTIASAPTSAEAGNVVAPVPLTEEPAPVSRPASGLAATPAATWRDGSYTGRGDSPHGGIDVRVVIKDGRIIEASILGCYTRYPCEEIDSLLRQPLERQSPDVDYVSHATESSDAYHDALVDALKSALYEPPGKETASQ
jgi:uncharacterized protein with FMN-binding domain